LSTLSHSTSFTHQLASSGDNEKRNVTGVMNGE